MKNIVNLKDMLREYDNNDHIKSINVVVESKQYCEALEVEIISLKAYLEKTNKWNEELLQEF